MSDQLIRNHFEQLLSLGHDEQTAAQLTNNVFGPGCVSIVSNPLASGGFGYSPAVGRYIFRSNSPHLMTAPYHPLHHQATPSPYEPRGLFTPINQSSSRAPTPHNNHALARVDSSSGEDVPAETNEFFALDDKVFQYSPSTAAVGYVSEYINTGVKYRKAKVVLQGGKLYISLPSGLRFRKPKPQTTLDHPKEILRRAAERWQEKNAVTEVSAEPQVPTPSGPRVPTPPPPAEPANSASTPPQKKRRVGDKQLNLDQNGVFQFPTTEYDHRQLKLLSEILDVAFKSSGQEAISPELLRPDDCVNAVKEAERLLSARRYQNRLTDFHQGLMHFMLSREVVLGPRGKQYFRDKVKDYRSIKPLQLFNEVYGWYNEDGLLKEEQAAEEEQEG